MNILRKTLTVIVMIALVLGFVSCDLLMSLLDFGSDSGTTVLERLEAFHTDLNVESRTDIANDHFHPDDMVNFSQTKYRARIFFNYSK